MNKTQSTFLEHVAYKGPVAPQSPDDHEFLVAADETERYMSQVLKFMKVTDFTPEFCEALEKKYESLPGPGRIAVLRGGMRALNQPGGADHVPVFNEFYKVIVHAMLDVFGTQAGVVGPITKEVPYVVFDSSPKRYGNEAPGKVHYETTGDPMLSETEFKDVCEQAKLRVQQLDC